MSTDPETRCTGTAGPSSYPLDHEVLVERIILTMELPGELRGRGILKKTF